MNRTFIVSIKWWGPLIPQEMVPFRIWGLHPLCRRRHRRRRGLHRWIPLLLLHPRITFSPHHPWSRTWLVLQGYSRLLQIMRPFSTVRINTITQHNDTGMVGTWQWNGSWQHSYCNNWTRTKEQRSLIAIKNERKETPPTQCKDAKIHLTLHFSGKFYSKIIKTSIFLLLKGSGKTKNILFKATSLQDRYNRSK